MDMNKETKEKEIKELHEFVLDKLFTYINDQDILKEIYICKDDKEIGNKIKNFINRRCFIFGKYDKNIINKYCDKLSNEQINEIKKTIIDIVFKNNEDFKENECVINYIKRGKFDDEIKELLQQNGKQNGKRLAVTPYTFPNKLLCMDSFEEIYNTEIKQQSSSSMTIEDYRRKLKEKRKYYILFEDSFRERFEFLEKEKLKKENEGYRNLTIKSKELAEQYKKTSMRCFGAAFAWFLLCWFFPYQWFQYNYFGEIFTFLSKLLFKLPSFVLCLVGVKFLYLFVQYKTEERELKMLDSYLEKLPSDCTKEKAKLVKQLAPHFFPDKKATKISQSFLQELLRKALEK